MSLYGIALGALKVGLALSFFVFVIFPLIFKYSYTLQRSVIFLNFINFPRYLNFQDPQDLGLNGSLNGYVRINDRITLGVWQILPEGLSNTPGLTKNDFTRLLGETQQVILYNHGNSGHRGAGHRLELYKVLRKNFFVIAYDYRGYGDSTKDEPSEMGLVNDSCAMYQWLRKRTTGKIYVWGHSLGTAISTRAVSILSKHYDIDGLILESPFNNMRDEISLHKFAAFFRYLPWFTYTVVDPMMKNGLTFESDKYILEVDCPILFLHAKDDLVVPFKLGKKLYEIAEKNSKKLVEFKEFDAAKGYGHKHICRAPELNSIIMDFVKESQKKENIDNS